MNCLITGASGFVGTALVDRLSVREGLAVRAATRSPIRVFPNGVEAVVVGDQTPDTVWRHALVGVETVVHLSGRVHITRDRATEPLEEFRRVNVAGTVNLARQAVGAGVKRFVFLSSIKVNGESGIYTERDPPAPVDAYGTSKSEAEHGLRQVSAETGMEVVIVRSPLVYGLGVKANFRALMKAVAQGVPLPFGTIHNRRSLVALENLVDFVLTCIEHPDAANETFLVSDGEDLSTSDLVRRLARAMGRPARLVPVPASVLMAGAALVGRRDVAQRLVGSLQVDISKARMLLGWSPPVSVDEGLQQAVASG